MNSDEIVGEFKKAFPSYRVIYQEGKLPLYDDDDNFLEFLPAMKISLEYKNLWWEVLFKMPAQAQIVQKQIKAARKAFAHVT